MGILGKVYLHIYIVNGYFNFAGKADGVIAVIQELLFICIITILQLDTSMFQVPYVICCQLACYNVYFAQLYCTETWPGLEAS